MYSDFNYLEDRVDKRIKQHKRKGFFLSFFYYFFFLVQILSAAALPLITLLPDTIIKNIVISSIGVVILMCQLLFNGVNFKEKIQDSKETLHVLETEKYLYLNKSGKYAQKSSDETMDIFVGEIEKCFSGLQKKSMKPKRRRDVEFS
ncbi:DUF4231 domain-containing protein [Vagococcus carniphilus]|uniref:DUF4231 domain-containing protein n=1 Tax=Vagococcus carniphilus TaxID=218144 RepID=A0A430B9D0_9ENTE|nr:DUF4231 domain-containing protein [Vagococcus carniphilus]QNN73551.1 DUF4231 domain-containing protein [Vagococcus carniphilus]RSU16929.1 hypothetical protein CBF28_01715 [Vagococcus carniphilus]